MPLFNMNRDKSPTIQRLSRLEGIIDFCEARPIFENDQQRSQAIRKFRRIVAFYEEAKQHSSPRRDRYNRPALIRLTFEYARSSESQDKFLGVFFRSLALEMLDDNDGEDASVRGLFFGFADSLIYHFFLPLLAATDKTPQPTPTYHSAVQQGQTEEEQQRMLDLMSTPQRLAALQGTCLTRDRHNDEGEEQDDEGEEQDDKDEYHCLEVAHILPFSLTKTENNQLSKKAAIAFLNMFDSGVIHLIEGTDIDRPYTAITLSCNMHGLFGKFKIFFKPVIGTPNTYEISAFKPAVRRYFKLPINRTLFSHETIDPPAKRLLELHSAIGHILHLSGAGNYISVILRDMEAGEVRADGSTQLGAIVNAALVIKG
ncbi:hypothetical protein QBC40DRAFT_305880 [Triangularia verruculosa]|uniref:HNH nuclease domain-containing protein n=1 Tax=Triangularia verruculosa TaxID=2587418 RepID=A0AAN6XLU3_9PEZI|nr:hypothetical protein QBC40DRAFT_305880 [Triangularia verruculosa]